MYPIITTRSSSIVTPVRSSSIVTPVRSSSIVTPCNVNPVRSSSVRDYLPPYSKYPERVSSLLK